MFLWQDEKLLSLRQAVRVFVARDIIVLHPSLARRISKNKSNSQGCLFIWKKLLNQFLCWINPSFPSPSKGHQVNWTSLYRFEKWCTHDYKYPHSGWAWFLGVVILRIGLGLCLGSIGPNWAKKISMGWTWPGLGGGWAYITMWILGQQECLSESVCVKSESESPQNSANLYVSSSFVYPTLHGLFLPYPVAVLASFFLATAPSQPHSTPKHSFNLSPLSIALEALVSRIRDDASHKKFACEIIHSRWFFGLFWVESQASLGSSADESLTQVRKSCSQLIQVIWNYFHLIAAQYFKYVLVCHIALAEMRKGTPCGNQRKNNPPKHTHRTHVSYSSIPINSPHFLQTCPSSDDDCLKSFPSSLPLPSCPNLVWRALVRFT